MIVKDLRRELSYCDDDADVFTDSEELVLGIYEDEHPIKTGEDAVFLETGDIKLNTPD